MASRLSFQEFHMSEINDSAPEQGSIDEFKVEVLALQDLEHITGGKNTLPTDGGNSNWSVFCGNRSTISNQCGGTAAAAALTLEA